MSQDWREHPSKTRPFKSRYGGGYTTAESFLAENMCARIARTKGIDLPARFWTLEHWHRTFRMQLRHATMLLRVYDFKAIIAALKRTPRAFSLGAKWLDPIFKEEQERLKLSVNVEKEAKPIENSTPTHAEPLPRRKAYGGSVSIAKRLDDL